MVRSPPTNLGSQLSEIAACSGSVNIQRLAETLTQGVQGCSSPDRKKPRPRAQHTQVGSIRVIAESPRTHRPTAQLSAAPATFLVERSVSDVWEEEDVPLSSSKKFVPRSKAAPVGRGPATPPHQQGQRLDMANLSEDDAPYTPRHRRALSPTSVSSYSAQHLRRKGRNPSMVGTPTRTAPKVTESSTVAFGSTVPRGPDGTFGPAPPMGWRRVISPDGAKCFLHEDSDRAEVSIPAGSFSGRPISNLKVTQVGPDGGPLPRGWRAFRLANGLLCYLPPNSVQACWTPGEDHRLEADKGNSTVRSALEEEEEWSPAWRTHIEEETPKHEDLSVSDRGPGLGSPSKAEEAVIYFPLPQRGGQAPCTPTKQRTPGWGSPTSPRGARSPKSTNAGGSWRSEKSPYRSTSPTVDPAYSTLVESRRLASPGCTAQNKVRKGSHYGTLPMGPPASLSTPSSPGWKGRNRTFSPNSKASKDAWRARSEASRREAFQNTHCISRPIAAMEGHTTYTHSFNMDTSGASGRSKSADRAAGTRTQDRKAVKTTEPDPRGGRRGLKPFI